MKDNIEILTNQVGHKAEALDLDYLKSQLDSFIDRSKFEKLEN